MTFRDGIKPMQGVDMDELKENLNELQRKIEHLRGRL
jgi:hypothetical protein